MKKKRKYPTLNEFMIWAWILNGVTMPKTRREFNKRLKAQQNSLPH